MNWREPTLSACTRKRLRVIEKLAEPIVVLLLRLEAAAAVTFLLVKME